MKADPMTRPVFLFDAYGTLFDVHSVTAALESLFPGKGAALSQTWRTKQLEYTWQRTLMQRYAGFNQVTAEALIYAAALHGAVLKADDIALLMRTYRELAPFPEVQATLLALKKRGARLGILSNGEPAMLNAAVKHGQLDALFEAVLSVHPLGLYKPAPPVYQLAVDRFGAAPQDIHFVSANGWDAAGAKSFGFQVCWVNRSRLPQETTGLPPDLELADLTGLL